MRLDSRGTEGFWQLYRALPMEVRKAARRSYGLWHADPFHPSLHFKKVGGENWSVRVGAGYRAIGTFASSGVFLWEWIGSHADYDKRV